MHRWLLPFIRNLAIDWMTGKLDIQDCRLGRQSMWGRAIMSINEIIIHDSRLRGCFEPHGRKRILEVNETTALAEISRAIRHMMTAWRSADRTMRATARRSQIPVLSILAHGAAVTGDPRGRDTALQVGRELIHSENALGFGQSLRGVFSDKIRILGCAMAETENGRQICRDLARGARTRLFASSSVQQYTTYSRVSGITGEVTYTWSNFGRWEGTVYEFSRDGSHRVAWPGSDIPRSAPGSRRGEAEPEERFVCGSNWRRTELRRGSSH